MLDDGDPHLVTERPRHLTMGHLRGGVSNAFTNLIVGAKDRELFDLCTAIDCLKNADRRLYQSLLGNMLLNDILTAIDDEYDYRTRQNRTGT